MRAPAFWWRAEPTGLARALGPLGHLVGAVAARRMARPPSARLGVPVVCVGNPTVGGAGKTPVAIALAGALRAAGFSPVFLSRGYGARVRAPMRVDGHSPAEVGDEPLLLEMVAPTIVSPDRVAGGRLARRLGDVVIMDDGFQNPSLHKDVALLVIDAAVGLGNAMVLPAGPLRAPLGAHLRRCDRIVLTLTDEPRARTPSFGAHPIDEARLVSTVGRLEGTRLHAFAGIGRPQKFFASLERAGAQLAARVAFADHHPYAEREAEALLRGAHERGARPATTAKDAVRLAAGGPAARRLARDALVADVEVILPAALVSAIVARIGEVGQSASK